MDLNQLETERLTLRPLAAADADDLFAARGDAEVMQHWNAEPDASADESAQVIGYFLAEMSAGSSMYWAIRLRQAQSFVGVCDLSDIRAGESADIGFMLARRFWELGFGGEITRCLLSAAQSLSTLFQKFGHVFRSLLDDCGDRLPHGRGSLRADHEPCSVSKPVQRCDTLTNFRTRALSFDPEPPGSILKTPALAHFC